jgi:hypothetical protein
VPPTLLGSLGSSLLTPRAATAATTTTTAAASTTSTTSALALLRFVHANAPTVELGAIHGLHRSFTIG